VGDLEAESDIKSVMSRSSPLSRGVAESRNLGAESRYCGVSASRHAIRTEGEHKPGGLETGRAVPVL